MVRLGEELGKPVVATGNVHYLNPEDKIYREILLTSLNNGVPQEYPDAHLRTTDEMLKEFAFLGEEKAYEVVVTNSNWVSDQLEEITPVKDELYTPKIEGAAEEITKLSYDKAHEWYGNPLPKIVEDRIKKRAKEYYWKWFFGNLFNCSKTSIKE